MFELGDKVRVLMGTYRNEVGTVSKIDEDCFGRMGDPPQYFPGYDVTLPNGNVGLYEEHELAKVR